VDSVAWFLDSRTVVYVIEDAAKRPYRAYRHVLGTDPARDTVLFEEKDERYVLDVDRTRSKAFLTLTSTSKVSSEVRVIDADDRTAPARLVAARRPDVQYFVEHNGDRFFIRTNDTGRNFRIVTAPVASTDAIHWTERRPQDDAVMIDSLEMFSDHYVLRLLERGLPQFEVVDLAGGAHHRIPLPETDYDASPAANAEFVSRRYRLSYESMTRPHTTFEWDLDGRVLETLKQFEVPGYAPEQYRAERLDVVAPDGVHVPISVVRRASTPLNGTAPLFIVGYGSYGIEMPAFFNEGILPLLDRGFVYAIAHIRGGGELGKIWHEQGRMMSKRNTFTDFIACTEGLMARGYGHPRKVVIEGGSAGGLLMGAVANMRPDLFRVVVAEMPFVDVINTMSDAALPETVSEYEEWGNPNKPDEYRYLRSYSPYDNLVAKAYPAMLVLSSYNDSQVMYWEPAKYVARMRALKTDDHPLLFRISMEPAGHGGKSGRYERVKEDAFEYAFILRELGLAPAL
jgi:oligopeptidase B